MSNARRPVERALGVFFDPAQTSLNYHARNDRAVVPKVNLNGGGHGVRS